MEQVIIKKEIINRLKKEILLLEGFKPASFNGEGIMGLGEIEKAFPNNVFPLGAIHEFLNENQEQAAACNGFIASLLQTLMKDGGPVLWISASRSLFPPALTTFGVEPDRIIFVDVSHESKVLWTMEEALKSSGLAAVVGELSRINFMQSRRLQLAVEKTSTTCFIIRKDFRPHEATACVARWKISPLPSKAENDMPGVGFPRWKVELSRARNGNPGVWQIEWRPQGFNLLTQTQVSHRTQPSRKIG